MWDCEGNLADVGGIWVWWGCSGVGSWKWDWVRMQTNEEAQRVRGIEAVEKSS